MHRFGHCFRFLLENQMCFATHQLLQFRRQVAPQESLICGGNIPKRKNLATQLCEILCMLTINIVINSTRVQHNMQVTTSCRYALSLMGRCFCFQSLLHSAVNSQQDSNISHHTLNMSVLLRYSLVDEVKQHLFGMVWHKQSSVMQLMSGANIMLNL